MCPGSRHVQHLEIDKFSGAIESRTSPRGQRRITKDPDRETLESAFHELGTHAAVASAFGVSRGVVRRWLTKHRMVVTSRPEVALADYLSRRLSEVADG